MKSENDYGPFVPSRVEELVYWCSEREAMRKRKAEGKPFPGGVYSKDRNMAYTRYCNYRRMDDKVSIWLMNNWYPTAEAAQEMPRRLLVVSAMLARTVNRPETLTAITGGNRFSKWAPEHFNKVMHGIKASGNPVFTGVYIINAAAGGDKIDLVLRSMDRCYNTKPFYFLDTDSMQQTAKHLCTLEGVGGFMSGQMVADLRWVVEGEWRDRMTWSPPGPGSSKGMRYLLGLLSPNEMDGRGKDMTEQQFLHYLPMLMSIMRRHPVIGPIAKDRQLEAQDYQNSLCELSKYIRVKHGGRGKNPYPPKVAK